MIYNDYRTYILTCEYLGKEPTGQYKKIHDYLTSMWEGMELVVDSRYNRIVLQKGDEWFFRQDSENGYLWCHRDRVWSFFETDMGMEYPEVQDFMKSAVEEHLKCEVGTLFISYSNQGMEVEEHLKCEVGTLVNIKEEYAEGVEEHLKCVVGTPVRSGRVNA